jgi:Zn-finger nucleic acid-binding protein
VATRQPEVSAEGKYCPRCRIALGIATVGNQKVLECDKCGGLWLDTQSFERICANTENQSAVLGIASIKPIDAETLETKVTYVPCPECVQLMNRVNFAHCSGVIIDVCKSHGVWFDRDELSRIVEFIRSGGLELSRNKEKRALEEERWRLKQERFVDDLDESDRISGIVSSRDLLKFLLG